MRLEYDHHFESTSCARFHTDHTNLCLGVVQIMTSESSENFFPCLVGGRNPVNKGTRNGSLNRARCTMLRNVFEWVIFYTDLWQNVLDTRLVGNMNLYPPDRWVVLVPGYLGRVLYQGTHVQGSIAQMSLIKRRLGSR